MKKIKKHTITIKFFIPLLLLSLTVLFCLTTVSAASNDTIYVNGSSGNDSWDGLSWATAKLSIKNTTGTVNTNGTIYIANGTYTGENNTNIPIDKNMTIIGQSQTGTIIDTQGQGRMFYINPGVTVNLYNLTLQNGRAIEGNGGSAIFNFGNLTVTNCTLTNNIADSYGGAICNGGTLTADNCTFTGNTAVYGGAIYDVANSNIENCTFNGNTATDGGAIYNLGNLTAENCTFNGNTAANNYGGGAIYNGNTISLSCCNFTNNTATNSDGGAIYNIALSHDVISTIVNCTFTGNKATYSGGAIASGSDGYSVTSSLTGCSFTGNVADRGGAIFNRGTLTANFNRFYNNTAEYGNAISGAEFDSVDIESNWWGSNSPDWNSLIDGLANPNNWVILSVNATPNNINNTKTSTIKADFNHVNGGGELIGGHIPDGPITLNLPWGSFTNSGITHSVTLNTVNGVVTAIFYAKEGAVPAINPVKVTAAVDGYTTNNTESAYITINKTSDLYIKIISDKKNTKVGETFTLTYKLGNNGPDEAKNVIITIPLPEGFELSNIRGDGNWTYNSATRTITWTLANVPVGDPYLYISGNVLSPGSYVFSSSISSETYNINSQGVTPITINAVNEVKAASKTIPLQETGLPFAGFILAVLAVFGGLLMPRRKN